MYCPMSPMMLVASGEVASLLSCPAICSSERSPAAGLTPGRSRMNMALGPEIRPYWVRSLGGRTWVEKIAPVLIDACTPMTSPIVGSAAVPVIRSRTGGMSCPSDTVTVSPTRLRSWSSVAGPSTIWPGPSSAVPVSGRGVIAAWTGPAMAGTVCPSISTVTKYTPVLAATSGSWASSGFAHRSGTDP